MKECYRKIVKSWEEASGYEAMGKENIRDRKTLLSCLRTNQKWLEEHFFTISRSAESIYLTEAWK